MGTNPPIPFAVYGRSKRDDGCPNAPLCHGEHRLIHGMPIGVSRGYERLPGSFERGAHDFDGTQIQSQRAFKVGEIVGERQVNHPVRSRGGAAQRIEIIQRAVKRFGARRL
ncbi:hypothetical protein HMSSN139_19930 [Paenibacillus sp. HMSSN-139]|nr:hypothetical protein HMSSN139_19930 [Paenibacillus sp. HMSSN-139]